jgi:predicted GNAT superfamily acetyltransferase
MKITSKQALKIITNIVHRFGVPYLIKMDNSTQFTESRFLEFYDEYNIHIDWIVVAHSCANGHVERANGMIVQGLKSEFSPTSSNSANNGRRR